MIPRNRIGVITGAGGALCGSLARDLASDGAKLLLLDINREEVEKLAEEIKDSGGHAVGLCRDVLNRESLEEALGLMENLWGPPHFLINGAGGNSPKATTREEFYQKDSERSFPDIPMEDLEDSFRLNFFGTVLPTQVFTKPMLEQGRGSVVNFSSMSAITPLTKVAAYSAAKAAVSNFTKWLAVHYSRTGVRVNALAPGFMMTEQLKYLHLDKNGKYTERAKKVLSHTPFERYGRPEELTGTVRWLITEESSFVTGAVIPIDGGFSSYTI